MTTAINDVVTIGANGLVLVCSYCLPRPRLDALNVAYPMRCSHGMCPSCHELMTAELDAMHGPVLTTEREIEECARARRQVA